MTSVDSCIAQRRPELGRSRRTGRALIKAIGLQFILDAISLHEFLLFVGNLCHRV